MVKNCIVASAVVFNKEGKVLLIKHKKFHTWIYPGGHVEDNEHPDRAAMREVLEETGMKVRIIDTLSGAHISDWYARRVAQPLAIMLENARYRTVPHKHFDLIYLAETVDRPKVANPDHEDHDMGWFSEKEIGKIDIRFKNVRYIIHEAFKAYRRLKRG